MDEVVKNDLIMKFNKPLVHLTLFSNKINVKTRRHVSTPRSSRGKCNGKSTNENLVWSGKAKTNGWRMLGSKISTSTRVRPGTGTGALNSRRIHVSISLTS